MIKIHPVTWDFDFGYVVLPKTPFHPAFARGVSVPRDKAEKSPNKEKDEDPADRFDAQVIVSV